MANLIEFGKPLRKQNDIDFGFWLHQIAYAGEGIEPFTLVTAGEGEVFLQPDGSCGETLETILTTQDRLPVAFSTGESLLIDLDTTKLLTIDFFDGASITDPITFPTQIYFDPAASSGEFGSVSLSVFRLFAADSRSGENTSLSLTTVLPISFLPHAYSGETGSASLLVTANFALPSYGGENSLLALSTNPSVNLETVDGVSGETSSVSITAFVNFEPIADAGETALFDLTYAINQGIPSNAYAGVTVETDLSINASLSSLGYSGENASLYLGTSEALTPIAHAGESLLATVTINIADLFDGYAREGQALLWSLSTKTLLPSIGFSGERAAFDLLQNLQPDISLPGYTGSRADLWLQIAFQIALNSSYSGERAYIPSLESEHNIRFYQGASFDAALSTTDAIKIGLVGAGESLITALEVGKSFSFGETRFIAGETLHLNLNTVYHADLYVVFRTSIMTQADIGSATYFDLGTDSCCGTRRETTSNNLYIQMFVNDYLPESVSEGDRVEMAVSLSCQPRFSVDFSNGTTLDLIDNVDQISVTFGQESCSLIFDFESDLTHRLCKGYFIPTGDWVVVEMQDVLPESCLANFFYGGSTFACYLSDDIVIRSNTVYDGGAMTVSLTVVPPWLFTFYAGESLLLNLSTQQALYPVPSSRRERAHLTLRSTLPRVYGANGRSRDYDKIRSSI